MRHAPHREGHGGPGRPRPRSKPCTCTIVRLADNRPDYLAPAEWEQDPWCPTHPDVDSIKAWLTELVERWENEADANEDTHPKEARTTRINAKELREVIR